jgi:hypothetical protein
MKDLELNEALKKYNALERLATKDLSGHPPKTLPGMQMAKREAQDALPAAREAYEKLLVENGLLIKVTGPAKLFLERARAAGYTVLYPNAWCMELCKPIDKTIDARNRLFCGSQMLRATQEYDIFCIQNEIREQQDPVFTMADYDLKCPTLADTAKVVKRAIYRSNGLPVFSQMARKEAIDQALANKANENVEVILVEADMLVEEEARLVTSFGGRPMVVLDIGVDESPEESYKRLKSLTKQLKTSETQKAVENG